MISAEELRRLLDYDPETGIFTWKVVRKGRPHGYIPIGTRAGSLYQNGYWFICINGRRIMAARLAVLWMTGRWPRHQIDHENRNRSDDRWSNLREATSQQNQANRINSNNRLGVKGVCWDRKKFKSSIQVGGRSIHLGNFDTAEEAQAAYAAAAEKYFGEFARTTA